MNLVCRNRFRISFWSRFEFGDAVKKSLPRASPSPSTAQSNITQASRWPFWNKAWASIKLVSDPGPDPISAGRICGRSSAETFAAAQVAIAATMKRDSLVELMRIIETQHRSVCISTFLHRQGVDEFWFVRLTQPRLRRLVIAAADGKYQTGDRDSVNEELERHDDHVWESGNVVRR